VTVDGVERDDDGLPLVDDRQEHSVEVRIPAATLVQGNGGHPLKTVDAQSV
jgi:hypothetical protein